MSVPRFPRVGGYFANSGQADDWLDFEAGPEEREQRSYAENDRFEEWAWWQRAWESGGI